MSDADIEDIEACALAGRRPRDAGPYRIQVGDAHFEFQSVIAPGPVLTGRALRELAALTPPHDHLCLALQTDGLLEEVRLDETIDLRAGIEKFFAFKNDRLYRFLLDGREYQWGGAFVTGAMLLKLAKLDPATHTVTQRLPEGGERTVGPAALVDLGEAGVEDFVTKAVASA
jgi:hypothetical protein